MLTSFSFVTDELFLMSPLTFFPVYFSLILIHVSYPHLPSPILTYPHLSSPILTHLPVGLRLAQLTNKCTSGEDDLEYFIAESGRLQSLTNIDIQVHIHIHIHIHQNIISNILFLSHQLSMHVIILLSFM